MPDITSHAPTSQLTSPSTTNIPTTLLFVWRACACAMPEKPLTVAAYAAGASLAAATLVYVFAPTYFLDNEPSGGPSASNLLSGGSRKKTCVGLVNPANDCFINSILQALAGLGDLRVYLIRELHRRSIDEPWIYELPVPEDFQEHGAAQHRSPVKTDLIPGQQMGLVTKGLKAMLDQLNERPIYKKTISAAPFVAVLEDAFKSKINRQQHDSQELLQVVVERLCDEYHAGHRARRYARWKAASGAVTNSDAVSERLAALGARDGAVDTAQDARRRSSTVQSKSSDSEEEEGFPMEGRLESQIECLTCSFKPQPNESRFCTLTLAVPVGTSSTTLNACFDGLFKTEYIDDYKCEKCRLLHAQEVYKAELAKAKSQQAKADAQAALVKLERAIETDPEHPPEDVALPDSSLAPRRKIARYSRITHFPKILNIHLSRSIYAGSAVKNSSKVAFPERLPLGGLLLRRNYKLLGVVAHKGGHDTGHYETFRRQNVPPPYSNPNTFQPSGVYSKTASPMSTPQIQPDTMTSTPDPLTPASASTPSLDSTLPTTTSTSKRGSPRLNGNTNGRAGPGPTSAPAPIKEKDTDTSSLRSIAASAKSTLSKMSPSKHRDGSTTSGGGGSMPVLNGGGSFHNKKAHKKRNKTNDKWWRISDEKIKEASTRELLGMQREVYLLFYEMDRDGWPGTGP